MPNAAGRFGRLSWLWLSLLVLVIDQASKFYFEGKLEMYQQIVVIPDLFSWTLAYNTGAAFSFLADSSGWQRWLFALIAVGSVACWWCGSSVWGVTKPGWPSLWRWCWVARWAICTTALPWAM
jgi:Lipoprotein signal peptidase